MRTVKALLVLALIGATTTVTASASTAAPPAGRQDRCDLPRFGPGAAYHPKIDPYQFGAHVDNPWFPLSPGTTYVYSGHKDGASAIDVFAVSRQTRVIDGVRTRVVHDRLLLDGVLHERTSDYYAQDRCGNVWYFGEDTAELDRHGRVVTREGSFRAGVRGAEPGVYMQAHPQLGRRFRQEWAPGEAEDQFQAISRHASVTVPYGSFGCALRTRETTALEPGVVDNKLYVRGVGQVQELAVKGGTEKLSLVDVLR